MDAYDPEQIRLMGERCIVVDAQDRVLGHESKKACHLLENIRMGLLHRAFSVFWFDHRGRLLLQQRASEKITFPGLWTNTCCSHPLYQPDELPEAEGLGARRAARRKLEHELGIPPAAVDIDRLTYLTRIHYNAAAAPMWGEHEIDYILLYVAQNTAEDVPLQVNPNEVQATQYVTPEEMRAWLARAPEQFTPWFRLIAADFLFTWWAHLDALAPYQDHTTIHRLGEPAPV
ncbi:hypothetical protein CXG81DRAFT_29692 [Caulochytrium protostelioides]|uniref:isopentenyl-diphosphate Delta-isomerase n=1 Tax=Caulochytrium protostelioides TaxID=1555241 RepID=A0A4P9X9B5_9FUNG|nr:hypothetical protein CXG81DRAFT_29692 [Caulochytrium protostelioides]|eukprot:RKP01670.1 hypothetical protein CXG81DRAFT_29692 [Caulochytrium protostelioides]